MGNWIMILMFDFSKKKKKRNKVRLDFLIFFIYFFLFIIFLNGRVGKYFTNIEYLFQHCNTVGTKESAKL